MIAADANAFERLADVLAESFEVTLSGEQRTVSVAAPDEAADLARVAGLVDERALQVDEIALRRPTLDDAFLALTGHPAHTEDEDREEIAA